MSFGRDHETHHKHVPIVLAVNLGRKRLLREHVHELVELRGTEADEL